MDPVDVHPCDLWRNAWEDRGQTVTICHRDSQRWYYLNEQRMDEATLIKIWDNDESSRAKCEPFKESEHFVYCKLTTITSVPPCSIQTSTNTSGCDA